jgi:hypothetical protein
MPFYSQASRHETWDIEICGETCSPGKPGMRLEIAGLVSDDCPDGFGVHREVDSRGLDICYRSSVFIRHKMFRYDSQG